jgi:hypothetical protein
MKAQLFFVLWKMKASHLNESLTIFRRTKVSYLNESSAIFLIFSLENENFLEAVVLKNTIFLLGIHPLKRRLSPEFLNTGT